MRAVQYCNQITKNVNRAHDIRVGNRKQTPQLQNYNNISQQNLNPHQKTTDFREAKTKSNNILILTGSMLKMLLMGEFNQFLQEGKVYLKSFIPGAKAKQLNHHATAFLAHQYDSSIIHVGINELLNSSSTY